MGRARWKGPFIHSKFLKNKNKNNMSDLSVFIMSRASVVLSAFVGYKVLIHTGKVFKKVFITREKVGYKFGEFCATRQRCSHKNKLKVERKGLK